MKNFTSLHYLAAFLLGVFCLVSEPAAAQIAFKTPAQQRKELKQSLKEAKDIETEYNESHLNVDAYQFEKGETGRKQAKRKDNPVDQEIMGEGTAAAQPGLFSKKRKAKKK